MTQEIEKEMGDDIRQLSWMSEATKSKAEETARCCEQNRLSGPLARL
jgi:hypothetical protein